MATLTILMYHMISDPVTKADERFACPPRLFKAHMKRLRALNYDFVSVDFAAEVLNGRSITKNSLAITFDDGYEDNYLNALPILEDQRIPATFFLVTGAMAGKNFWMSQPGFSERKMMNWVQAKEIAERGHSVGSHTVTHPRLTTLEKKRCSIRTRAVKTRNRRTYRAGGKLFRLSVW